MCAVVDCARYWIWHYREAPKVCCCEHKLLKHHMNEKNYVDETNTCLLYTSDAADDLTTV